MFYERKSTARPHSPAPNLAHSPARRGIMSAFPVSSRKTPLVLVLLTLFLLAACKPQPQGPGDEYFGNFTPVNPGAESLGAPADWYSDARFYHIWVNAFSDSDGDGIGDIPGIVNRLDYLEDLGINAIWLSPIFETKGQDYPQGNMHGYDTTDHYEINPYFGDTEDVRNLLDQAHSRGIRVIFDFVPNHVSTQHPWFQYSVENSGGYGDWFVWEYEDLDNYYDGPWGQEVWHRASNGRYYYGVFWDGMPDLNYENPEVRESMASVVTHWLNFGFDGIRVDAVKYVYEQDTDDNPRTAPIMEDTAATREYFAELREKILDHYGYRGFGKFMVVENWTNTDKLDTYAEFNGRAAAQMSFDFDLGGTIFYSLSGGSPAALSSYLSTRDSYDMPSDFRYGNFLSNHDNVRSRPMTETGDNTETAKMAAAYNILLPGVPFVYYGNEVGMTGAAGDDIDLRQDLNWADVTSQTGDSSSLLEWYRALLTARKNYDELGGGQFTDVSSEASNGNIFAGLWQDAASDTAVLFVGNHNSSGVTPESMNLSGYLSGVGSGVTTIIGSDNGAGFSSGSFTSGTIAGRTVKVYVLGSGSEPVLLAP
ncbi:alpha-amylase family glycosyl hydrolase [Salinispira pacifica]|uniref:Alpha-glucosidase/glycosyl hydrolase n=1 Tax=Salinispira pacifica TaxID=1307761 RepID=V5WEB6_9SPIO|nr:alpha-amylase family glycosyl hydrolase [Salinispira pacifica]AHC13980.1 Alpha-glucosidase/glycosyl hydrolase [Salinispira pacifica]